MQHKKLIILFFANNTLSDSERPNRGDGDTKFSKIVPLQVLQNRKSQRYRDSNLLRAAFLSIIFAVLWALPPIVSFKSILCIKFSLILNNIFMSIQTMLGPSGPKMGKAPPEESLAKPTPQGKAVNCEGVRKYQGKPWLGNSRLCRLKLVCLV